MFLRWGESALGCKSIDWSLCKLLINILLMLVEIKQKQNIQV